MKYRKSSPTADERTRELFRRLLAAVDRAVAAAKEMERARHSLLRIARGRTANGR
jgi:hypothetical protein